MDKTIIKFGLLLLVVCQFPVRAVVNTEVELTKYRTTDTSGNIEVRFSGREGNVSSHEFGLSGSFGWHRNDAFTLFMGERVFGKFEDQVSNNESFFYVKNLQSLYKKYSFVSFLQLEKNEFQEIKLRSLAGAGVRLQADKKHTMEISAFYENIDSQVEGETDQNAFRANLMWHFDQPINERVSFYNSLYVQPKFDQLSDVQAINQSRVEVELSDNLSLGLYLNATHFSHPRRNAKSTDIRYGSSVNYSF